MLGVRVKLPNCSFSASPSPSSFLFFPKFPVCSSSSAVFQWFHPVSKRSSPPEPISPCRMSSMGKRCVLLVDRKTVYYSPSDGREYAPALPLDRFHECMLLILRVHFCAAIRVELP